MRIRILLLAAIAAATIVGMARAAELRVFGAGSLREVMAVIGGRYHEATGIAVINEFGPSGLMRERIEKGERVDLFASADLGHPLKLLHDGRATRVALFVRNTLCGVAVPKVGLTTANFIDRLLDPTIKLGTSTPKADPAGDYTWAMFRRIDVFRPGSSRACGQLSQIVAAVRWMAARKFLSVLS
jgi:molybdate transport system substrate-binding protein